MINNFTPGPTPCSSSVYTLVHGFFSEPLPWRNLPGTDSERPIDYSVSDSRIVFGEGSVFKQPFFMLHNNLTTSSTHWRQCKDLLYFVPPRNSSYGVLHTDTVCPFLSRCKKHCTCTPEHAARRRSWTRCCTRSTPESATSGRRRREGAQHAQQAQHAHSPRPSPDRSRSSRP